MLSARVALHTVRITTKAPIQAQIILLALLLYRMEAPHARSEIKLGQPSSIRDKPVPANSLIRNHSDNPEAHITRNIDPLIQLDYQDAISPGINVSTKNEVISRDTTIPAKSALENDPLEGTNRSLDKRCNGEFQPAGSEYSLSQHTKENQSVLTLRVVVPVRNCLQKSNERIVTKLNPQNNEEGQSPGARIKVGGYNHMDYEREGTGENDGERMKYRVC